MNNLPKVSVIIPTDKYPHLIGRAIRSVLNQTYQNFEIVIIDGSPNDETEKAIQPYLIDSRICYIRQKEIHNDSLGRNIRSPAKARKEAIKVAKGKYIAILDSDDAWCDQRKIEKQVQFLEYHSDYVLCGGGMIIFEENSKTSHIKMLTPEKDEDIRKSMLFFCPFVHGSIMFRKNIYEEVGGYYEKWCYGPPEDWDLCARLGIVGKLYNFQDYFLHCTMRSDTAKLFSRGAMKKAFWTFRLMTKYRDDYPHFYKALLYFSVGCIYSIFLFPFRGILKPVRSKIRKIFNNFIGVSFSK